MKKILTIILDGFGYNENVENNAIKNAKMNVFENLWNKYPHSLLEASGKAVGLKDGQMGNSEVGHMTIGAGRVLKQNEILVDDFLANPDLENKNLIKLLGNKEKDVHIMGLCSDGNIHAGIDDFINMYKFLIANDFKKIHFHLITDGRDTGIHDAMQYITVIEKLIKENGIGDIVSICGRYFAMDRDNNWNRTQLYYDLVVHGIGVKSLTAESAIKNSYNNDITDEFIRPIILSNNIIKNGDVLIWMNYREDRSRQILNTLVNYENFGEFSVDKMDKLDVFTFFIVDKKIKTNNLIEMPQIKNTLGLYLSELDFTQARISETEKYAHVTYFFDCGYEGKIKNCDKFHIPSPDVATYDLKPEMSCIDVTKKVVNAMDNDYDFILVNYANPDMVGHTGDMNATTNACIAVDICLDKLLEKAEENFYTVIVTADHGNADIMVNKDGSPCTTHTLSKVPFILCDNKIELKSEGTLANIAPTILDYMDIAIPIEMEETGSLLINED